MNIADDTPTDEIRNTSPPPSPPLVVVTLDVPPGVDLRLTVNGIEVMLDE